MFRKVFKIFDDLPSLNCLSDIGWAPDIRGCAVNELKSFS